MHATYIFNERRDQTLSFGMIPILPISPAEMVFPVFEKKTMRKKQKPKLSDHMLYYHSKIPMQYELMREKTLQYMSCKKQQSGGGHIIKPYDKQSLVEYKYVDSREKKNICSGLNITTTIIHA